MNRDVVAETTLPTEVLWHDLGSVLVEQQDSLQKLLFRLDQEHLILITGRSRWLAQATAEVMAVGDDLAAQESRRRSAVDRIAIALGCSPDVTLEDLAALAPEGWADVFLRHREIMKAGVADVQTIVVRNRAVVAERLNSANALLNRMGASAPVTYGRDATMPTSRSTGRYVRGSM